MEDIGEKKHNPVEKTSAVTDVVLAVLVVAICTIPIIGIGVYSYLAARNTIGTLIEERRQEAVSVAAQVMEERFDRLKDVGVSIATRVHFRRYIQENDWVSANLIVQDIPIDFPYIDRILLSDPMGISMTDVPGDPEIFGLDVSGREWYRSVVTTRAPVISPGYRRATDPELNVVTVATPIFALPQAEEATASGQVNIQEQDDLIGIVVMHINQATFMAWAHQLARESDGYVSLIDPSGSFIAGTDIDPNDVLIHVEEYPPIASMMAGAHGIGVYRNPMTNNEEVVAYQPIGKDGWGILLHEPVESAYAPLTAALNSISFFYVFLFALNASLSAYIVRYMHIRRRGREHTLVQSAQAQFQALVENSSDVFILVTKDGKVKYESPAVKRVLGYNPGERIGSDAFELVHPEDLGIVKNAFGKMLGSPQTITREEFRVKHADGTWRWLEVVGRNLTDNPQIGAVVVNYRDITEQKEDAKRLQERSDELERMNSLMVGRELKMAEMKKEIQHIRTGTKSKEESL